MSKYLVRFYSHFALDPCLCSFFFYVSVMNGSKNGGTGNIAENGTADVAVDQYHRYKVWSI